MTRYQHAEVASTTHLHAGSAGKCQGSFPQDVSEQEESRLSFFQQQLEAVSEFLLWVCATQMWIFFW